MALWAGNGVCDVLVTFASLLFKRKDGCCPVGAGVGSLGLERQYSLMVESTEAGAEAAQWGIKVGLG